MEINEYTTDPDFRESLDAAGIELEWVKNIIHYRSGENEEASWLIVLELYDGRFAYVSAWCDYTGWDCQGGAEVSYANSLEELIPKMDTEGRMAFDYEPTPDCGV